MTFINRCSCRRPGSGYGFQDQVRLIAVVLVCLSLFQLVDASKQSSSSSSKLSLPLGNGNDNASQKERSRGQAVISLVPNEDRGMFIIYHLAKALNFVAANGNGIAPRTKFEPNIPQKTSGTFKDIQIYDTFPNDLLKWTIQMFRCSYLDIYSLLRNYQMLCTPKGLCFNPNDIGSMCCPF